MLWWVLFAVALIQNFKCNIAKADKDINQMDNMVCVF